MVKLTYEAKSVQEFKELALWMKGNGFENGVQPPAQPSNKGPYEIEWLRQSGELRMRLSKEEQASGLTREDVAKQRLGVDLPDSPPEMSVEDVDPYS